MGISPGQRARNDLVVLLADCYPDVESSRRIAAGAGLEISLIAFSPAARNNWFNVVEHAVRSARLLDLIDMAAAEQSSADVRARLAEIRRTLAETGADRPHDTPVTALGGASFGQTTYLTGGAVVPLWRRVRAPDELRFNPPAKGFADGDTGTRVFRLDLRAGSLFLGRAPLHGGHKNDLVLPHRSVSQQCLEVTRREGRTLLRRLDECRAPVTLGMVPLEPGEERAVYHGQVVTIGQVPGVFVDGRYTQPLVSAHTVDPLTGLLGRDGIAWEVAFALREGAAPELLLVEPAGEGTDAAACRIARALHTLAPSLPVARMDACAIVMLAGEEPLSPLVDAARQAAGAPVFAGQVRIDAPYFEAGARVEDARAALHRAAAIDAPGQVLDLRAHAPRLVDVPRFDQEAAGLLGRGGEVVLLALSDRDRLDQLGPGVSGALEREVLAALGRAAGPEALLARPLPGVVAAAAPSPLATAAREVAAGWRALGPVRGDNIEVERGICVETVRAPDAPDLARRALDLASGPAQRVEALPAPLSLRVRAALAAAAPLEEATTFVALVHETFRFAAVTLASMLPRASETPRLTAIDGATWAGLAARAAPSLARAPGRAGALVSTWFDAAGAPRGALAAAERLAATLDLALARRPLDLALLHREAPAIRPALDDLVAALGALRGWALVAVLHLDFPDPDREVMAATYVDYTGSFELGTTRRVTLLSARPLRSVVYLSRFAEGVAVPLDPFVRRRRCALCGTEELFWSDAVVAAPGRVAYRSVHRDHVLEDEVRRKDIPPALRPVEAP